MKKLALIAALLGSFAMADTAFAVQAAPVNIAYPLDGSTVVNNFYTSFTANCPTGRNTVSWYFNGAQVGKAFFYDTVGIHFSHRLAPGTARSLKVVTSCGGSDSVFFNVQ